MNKSSKKILSFVIAFIFCFALINPISFSAVNRKDGQVNTVNFAIAKEVDKNEIQDLTSNYLTKNEKHTHISSAPADCLHKQVCDICGEEFGEHKIVTDYYQAPTCTKDGLTPGSHCSVCGKVIIAQRVIAKKGHTVVTDEAVPATCTEYGKSIGSHCSECGEVLTKQTPTPKAPHVDNDNDNKCDVCGNKVTENPIIEQQEDKMPTNDIVLIVLSIIGFVVIFALVIAILKPKKKR